MLITAVQQSDSVIYIYTHTHTHIHIHTFIFIFFSIMIYHRVLNIVPHAIQLEELLDFKEYLSNISTFDFI